MIQADQPKISSDRVRVSLSSVADGTMLNRTLGIGGDVVIASRRNFCQQNEIDYSDVVYQWVSYTGGAEYDQIVEVDERSSTKYLDGVPADALITRTPGVGLMLPVADCVATVVYDHKTHTLAMLHMGRHSTLTNLIERVIKRLIIDGCDAANLQVWMSPHATRESYKLDFFDHVDDPSWQNYVNRRPDGIYIDMSGYNRQKFIELGVLPDNIEVSKIDTVTSQNYYSHSAGDTTGRFAVLAYLQ